MMKSSTTATAAYESPKVRVVEIDAMELLSTSPTGRSNEEYEEGDTSGWYSI